MTEDLKPCGSGKGGEMTVEGGEKSLLYKILNKQFAMIGEKMTFEELPESGEIEVKGKKMMWYNHYKWESMEQYEKWKEWAWSKLEHLGETMGKRVLTYIDFRYGLIVRLKKEGTLF
jgi:hypothetical protein